ncbi:endonuclease/exonuclease/phosphatase family protein [Pedobacter immunditicola]|uniref:endonuclease/exonuclease/phosphatase family protein n=1 Tax=Pedobacter immunditicola TaxID=3133440 RepID=UPI0030B5AF07
MNKYFLPASLFMLVLCSQINTAVGQNFKVLSYNVLKGLQQDSLIHQEYFKWVKEIDPDIVAYQEMNDFTQASLETFAAKYNHPYAIQSKLKGFPVALSSKYPITNVRKVVDNMWHAFIYANINNIHVFVIHFSPFYHKKRKEEIRNVLAHAATLPKNEKTLIMGDFNALSPTDASNYTDDMVKKMQESEAKASHIRNLSNGKLEYSVIDQIEKAGYKDTFWLTNKLFKHSIPTKKYGSAHFKRIDFMFANPEIAKQVKSSTIIHDQHTDQMSDHYPVLVTFDLKK